MEKEKIFSELKQRIDAQTDKKITLDDRTIQTYVDNIFPLMPESTEFNDAFYSAHLNALYGINGEVNHEVATRVEQARKNHANQPTTPPASPIPPADSSSAEHQEKHDDDLRKMVEQLILERQQEKEETEKERRLSKMQELVKNASWAKNKTVLNYALKETAYEKDMSAESYTKKCEENYNKIMTDFYGNGGMPGYGENGVAGGSGGDIINSFISQRREQSKKEAERMARLKERFPKLKS